MLDFTGIDAVLQRLTALERQAAPATEEAVDREMEHVLFMSQPLVPYKTGHLLGTGEVEPAHATGVTVQGAVRYGGHGSADYALVQHEWTGFNHRVGTHHYLSQPLFEATGDMLQHLADTISKRLGGTP
jgi:hypothetical protein